MIRTSRLALALVLLAAAALHAAPTQLSAEQARHLLVRTGFAPTQAEVDRVTGQDAGVVVRGLLVAAKSALPLHPPPDFVHGAAPIPARLLASVAERQEQRREQLRQGLELKRWWMREMIESRTPLRERMTLFWHGHFATSQQKVVRSQAMWHQHELLRAHALHNFGTLLHAVAKDPAMLVYLDGVSNRKGAPNENFAREVLELFTLGEASQNNRYSERDVQEAARAFTGWSIERDDFSFRFRPALHDEGSKTVFGRSGRFDGDAVLDLVLEQPGTAEFVIAKLWREFVSPTPREAQVQRIARRFAQGGFDISDALGELLLSDDFWATENRGSLVKSPIELVVGSVRQFEVGYTDTLPFVVQSALQGQNLLVPPNVKGWPGYTAWIDANTLLVRNRFGAQLFQLAQGHDETMRAAPQTAVASGVPVRALNQPMTGLNFDAQGWLARYGADPDREPGEVQRARIEEAVLAVPATRAFAAGTVALAYLRALVLDPAYQLK